MSFDQPTMHDQPSGATDIGGPHLDGNVPPNPEWETVEAPPAGVEFDDPDSEWLIEDNHKELRLRIPTAVLLVLLLAASGFWGGAALQKHHAKTTAATGAAATRAAFAGAAAARGGFGGTGATGGTGTGTAGGAATAATSGLVTEVQGNIVYVTDTTGALVKVTTSPTTTITRSSHNLADGLQTGDTVTVRGTKAADGSVTATAIIATAQGVQGLATGGAGGFSRTGGAGGGTGAGG
jgi:hypothetical protein